MIKKELWLSNLVDELKILSDFEFQKRVWVDYNTQEPWEEWSSWVESMCGLYDDCFLNDFLDKNWHEFGLSNSLFIKFQKLREELNKFKPFDDYDHKAIVYHKNWYPITLIAKDVLTQLEQEKQGREFKGVIE